MSGFLSRATILLPLALGIPFALHAQGTTRDLSGRVTDHSQEPLSGAVVQLENDTTHAVVSYITDRRGSYSFKRIEADADFHIWATYKGQRSRQHVLDKFNTQKNPHIDLVIQLR